MPSYIYRCCNESCKTEFEIIHSIKDPLLTTCPDCEQESLKTIPVPIIAFVKGEALTIGAVADKNYKANAGKFNEEAAKQKEKLNLPEPPRFKGDDISTSKLASLTPEKKQKYIVEGKV